MTGNNSNDRRAFLIKTIGGACGLGAGILVGNQIFADPTRIASKVAETPSSHPLAPALQMGTKALESLDGVKDYTADFAKRELIGRKLLDSQIKLKLREDPFSVYLKILKPVAGREALYVAGQHDGKMKAHDVGFAGLAGTLSLDVNGSFAMSENRYPITMAGMKTMASKVLEQWLNDLQYTDLDVNYYPNARIGQTSCKAIETIHRQHPKDVKFQMTRLYVEQERGLPIRVQQYEFPGIRQTNPVLAEDYLYSNIKLNAGLTDKDFSLTNPEYNF
ncbi:DUF1571 domain-containing protein [Thalassoglobus sp. JC818]|uniref:DUF1571 domain-containing protein n=1 Tax=Thalassoglobus sp. JC818 TaxID=3232136 RepID=UPI00345A038A